MSWALIQYKDVILPKVNIMAADGLAMQGVMPSAAMVLP